MIDNRTTELREKLTERGARYEKSEDDTTIYYDGDGNRYTYNVNPDSGWAQLFGYNLTPEQAIAATLGGGECEWMLREKWPNRTGDDYVYGYETSCGARHTWWPDSLPSFCPTCGVKVKAVKR